MAHTLAFQLVRAEACFFLLIGCIYVLLPHLPGQSYLFIGPHVPFAMPWRDAPFREYMTQPGLEKAWPTAMLIARSMGLAYLMFGFLVWHLSTVLLAQSQVQTEYELKRGKRGTAVHSKIERIEQAEQGAKAMVPLPPLWLLVVAHLACAAGNQYMYHAQPYGVEFTWWATTTATAVHLADACAMMIAFVQAKRLWAAVAVQKIE